MTEPFDVVGLFSDLRHHYMGPGCAEVDFGGNVNRVWRTPPLWGVGSGFPWGHDGQSLTAKDVAFTYNLVMNHEDFPTLHSYIEHFTKVEAPDDKTVVITLDEAVPNMESKLVFLYILPEHIEGSCRRGCCRGF